MDISSGSRIYFDEFEIDLDRRMVLRAGEMLGPQHQRSAGRALLHRRCTGGELGANRGADEVGAVRVEAVLHQQVDMAEIDVAEVDGDLLGLAAGPALRIR